MHISALGVGGLERRDLEERAVLDRAVDPLEVLVEHAPRADRQVAHLRIAHLAGRQADALPRGRQRHVRALGPEPVEHGRLRELDGVPRPRWRAAPAVQDDEDYETSVAAWQIAVNDSTSSEAPPTKAPSIPSCASSSAALSGLTEPPYSTGASSNILMKACGSRAISGVAVPPVPIAQTGSYAITSPSCPPAASAIASTWIRSTSSV